MLRKKKLRVLYDEPFKAELQKTAQHLPEPLSKEAWKVVLDTVVNEYFPGTGENYEIVIPRNANKSRTKV